MVNIGQNVGMRHLPEITPIGFQPPGNARLKVEILSIAELLQRAPAAHFRKLQRADFFRLIGVLEGRTQPMVDFSQFTASVGNWLLVRPGQVFRYDFSKPWGGLMMVFQPEGLSASGANRGAADFDWLHHVESLATLHSLNAEQHSWMHRSLVQMQADAVMSADLGLRNELLRLELASALLRLAGWQSSQPVGTAGIRVEHPQFRRFRKLLETDFTAHRQVQHYAHALGMSGKTLSRVCVAAAGAPAKTLINQRLVLEARRLLAHTSLTVQTIAHELGFDEVTNFVKFFRKETSTTPLRFRQQQLP
jgi:AraC-like DNA-binding protein